MWEIELANAIFNKAKDNLHEATLNIYRGNRLSIFPSEVIEYTEIIPNHNLQDYLSQLYTLIGKESYDIMYEILLDLVSDLMEEVEEIYDDSVFK